MLAPEPAGVFGQPALGRGDAPITRAQQTADRHRRRAEAAMPTTTVPGVQRVPDVPLNHRQRQSVIRTAQQVAARAREQGIDVEDAATNGDPVTRDFFAKAAQAVADERKHVSVKAGLAQIRANPEAFGIKPQQLEALHKLAARDAIPEEVRTQIAGIGERSAAASRKSATARTDAHGIGGPFIPAVVDSVKGVGALQSAAKSVAHLADSQAAQLAIRGLPVIGAAANLPVVGKTVRKVTTNAIKDMINLPAEAIPSLYGLAAQATEGRVDAAGGRHASARDATLKAGEMLAQPYIDVAQHPIKSFVDHPVNTALLFSGAEGAVGRTLGRAGRALPGDLGAAASTARASRTVPGTALEQTRAWSPDVIRKGGQVAVERARQGRANRLGRKAAASAGDRAEALQAKAHRARGTQMPDRDIRRRVDERLDLNETLRREDRGKATGAANRAIPRELRKGDDPTTVLVAQNIIKPNDADLRAYRDELVAGHPTLSHAKLAASKVLVRHIDAKLKSGVDWARVQHAAAGYRTATAAGQAKLGDAGILDPAQIERRALMPYAVRHMD
ncbi:MAG TPA: hypothetical protein VGM33_11600, partial [Baekduia sp.]